MVWLVVGGGLVIIVLAVLLSRARVPHDGVDNFRRQIDALSPEARRPVVGRVNEARDAQRDDEFGPRPVTSVTPAKGIDRRLEIDDRHSHDSDEHDDHDDHDHDEHGLNDEHDHDDLADELDPATTDGAALDHDELDRDELSGDDDSGELADSAESGANDDPDDGEASADGP